MALKVFVHTLGDLENLYALLNNQGTNIEEAKRNSVEGQLKTQLTAQDGVGFQYEVVSHAFQGFDSNSVLKGDTIGKHFHQDLKKDAYLKQKRVNPSSLFVKPLELLFEHAYRNPGDHHFVVISVGRHDLREKLGNPFHLIDKIQQMKEKYFAILDRIKNFRIDIKPILVFQYRTNPQDDPIYHDLAYLARRAVLLHLACMGTLGFLGMLVLANKISIRSGFYGLLTIAFVLWMSDQIVPLRMTCKILKCQRPSTALMKAFLENLYRPILQRAQREEIPVVDLTNTFNPYNPKLYVSGIEPSSKGGELIAKVICQVLEQRGCRPHIYTDAGSSAYVPLEWKVY